VTNRPLFLATLAVCFIWLLLAFAANGLASLQPPPKLPPLSDNPADLLRGAQLTELPVWSDLTFSAYNWTNIGYFPNWGGNAFRLFLMPFADGKPILPGRPLTERLSKSLERFTTVIDWALQHNIHFIVCFNPYYVFPPPAADWPDDGRSLWKNLSAQDELVQAWADLAKHFKGKKGIIFDLINEPHGITQDEINGNHALPKKVWNALYPRLINAIRAEDPERWIIVEPIWGDAGNFVDLSVSSAPNLIYSFHFYDPHFFTHQGVPGGDWPPAQSVVYPGRTRDADFEPERFWDKSVLEQRLLPAINFRQAHNVRVMCGEFGAFVNAPNDSRSRWMLDLIDLLETYGFDWLYFVYEARRDGNVGWTFEATSFESVVTSKFSLNLITVSPVAIWTPIDSDGDGKSDIGVYRDGEWHILRSSDGSRTATGWGGLPQDLPVPADYDGDGKTDIAVYRDGVWYILRSSDAGATSIDWGGLPEDIPAPADYDGDGKTDIAVYRSGTWFVLHSSDDAVTMRGWGGLAQDIPIPADYDGDGKTDIAVYRDGSWFILRSADGGVTVTGWGGLPQDIPVPADYDGDGKTDIAVYRDGTWFILRSLNGGVTTVEWGGLAQDILVPADYDGDGKSDVTVYRDGNWYVLRSSDGGVFVIGWGGLAQDIPLN
jgi:hypothetical protein